MRNTTELGRQYEAIAEKFYHRLGFVTLEKNFRQRVGELDLVMKRGGLLLFIEVKGRSGDWEAQAWLPGWRRKLKRLRATIERYLVQKKEIDYTELRLEIVFVTQGRVAARFEEI